MAESRKNLYRDEPQRHGFEVLNAEEPSEITARFNLADNNDEIKLENVDGKYDLLDTKLAGYTIKIYYRIKHKVGETPGEFDGMYVGDESHSMPHPLLLIPSDQVVQTSK